jgi:hypothetical protein
MLILIFIDWNEQSLYEKRRNSNVPNYFFPKMDRYPDLRTATLVFLVSSLGNKLGLIEKSEIKCVTFFRACFTDCSPDCAAIQNGLQGQTAEGLAEPLAHH